MRYICINKPTPFVDDIVCPFPIGLLVLAFTDNQFILDNKTTKMVPQCQKTNIDELRSTCYKSWAELGE
jgi:hypothetical protein